MPSFGNLREDSRCHPMLITGTRFRLQGDWDPRREVASLGHAECPVEFDLAKF